MLGACERRARKPRPTSASDTKCSPSDHFAGGELRRCRRLRSRLVQTPVARGLRYATLVVEPVSRSPPLRVPARLSAEAICTPLVLETICSLAQSDRIGGDRPSPEAQGAPHGGRERRAEGDVQAGDRGVSGYCGAQLFETIGLAGEVVDAASREHRHGSLALDSRRSRTGRSAGCGRERREAQLANPAIVPQGREAHDHAGGRRRLARLDRQNEQRAAPRVAVTRETARRTTGWRGSSTGERRTRSVTCSTSRRASRSTSTRSSRPTRSSVASRAARCRTARFPQKPTRRLRSPSTRWARARTAARAARIPRGTEPTARRRSSRSHRMDGRRARSQTKAASCGPGLRRRSRASAHAPGRGADRRPPPAPHLLDRGSRFLRPAPGRAAGGRLSEARLGGGWGWSRGRGERWRMSSTSR